MMLIRDYPLSSPVLIRDDQAGEVRNGRLVVGLDGCSRTEDDRETGASPRIGSGMRILIYGGGEHYPSCGYPARNAAFRSRSLRLATLVNLTERECGTGVVPQAARTSTPHKGTSAHEQLTGERVDDWLTLLGYPPGEAMAQAA